MKPIFLVEFQKFEPVPRYSFYKRIRKDSQ